MKPVIKFWAVAGLVLVLLFVLLLFYERFATNGNGYLGVLNISVLFQYLAFVWVVLTLLSTGLTLGKGWLTNVSLSLSSLFFFWFLIEVICFSLIQSRLIDASRPFHSRLLLNKDWQTGIRPFWGDFDRTFGMRDRDRTLKNLSGRKRVVLLGDSFVEGYTVQAPQRYSNILEDKTQCEHLNFGINSTSVINYWLTYKSLAQRFEDDVVLVSILLANDFEDYEEKKKPELLRHPIYRPYWEGQFPDVTLSYSLSDLSQSFINLYGANKPIHTQRVVDSVYHSMPFTSRGWAEFRLNSYLYSCILAATEKTNAYRISIRNSFAANSYRDRWGAFAYSFEQLAKDTQGKPIIACLIPIESDLDIFDKTHENDLKRDLGPLCRKYGVTLIDFLPVFHALGRKQWQKLYLSCDGHLSPRGEQFMATFLLHNPAYLRALGMAERTPSS